MLSALFELLKSPSVQNWILIVISAGLLGGVGKGLKHLRDLVSSMGRLPETEKTVAAQGGTLQEHTREIGELKTVTTDHGEKLEVLHQTVDRHGKVLLELQPPGDPAIRDTIQGK